MLADTLVSRAEERMEKYDKGESIQNYQDILLLNIAFDKEWQEELNRNEAEMTLCQHIMDKIRDVEDAIKGLAEEIGKSEEQLTKLEEKLATQTPAVTSPSEKSPDKAAAPVALQVEPPQTPSSNSSPQSGDTRGSSSRGGAGKRTSKKSKKH